MANEISSAAHTPEKKPFLRLPRLRPKYLLFGFFGLMLAYVLVHDEAFLFNAKDREWTHIQSFRWWLLPHGLTGACALFLGPMQFSERLRKRYAKFHRVVGRIYVAAVLFAAPAGVIIQHANERLGDARSFTIETMLQGGVWLLTTVIALAFILNGKFSSTANG